MTSRVMDLINAEPERKPYKPIIGRGGRMFIFIAFVATIVVSLIYTEPGTSLFGFSERLSGTELQLPQLNFKMEFLSGFNLSKVVASGVASLFVLLVTDSLINKRKLI